MMVHKKILIASTNKGKVTELAAMLGADVEWVGLSSFKQLPQIEEDGATFAENARKKALGYSKATGLWTLADDSGLVVDALGGEPGVKSARFAGVPGANRKEIDRANITKVLGLLEGIPRETRTARFICALCLASPEKILIETEGSLEGIIARKPVGENGFGYDPIFYLPQLQKTVAQLTAEEKNALSHRGNAVRNLKPLLEMLLSET